MNIKRTFEEFINEKREDVGKYNTVKKVIAKLGRRPSEQDLATFINNNYYDVTEVERGDDDPQANDKIADLVGFYKFDIEDWEIAWADAQNESVVTEGKTSAVYTDPKTGKGYDLQYVSSKKRWELDIMKKGASIYSNAITTIKRDTLAEIQEWLDGYKIDSSWTKGLSESVVNEAKNTIGLAFKDEDDYNGFVEFIEDEGGKIFKNIGWDSKTKSWEVIMDIKVLDSIYGEGTPGNKESGWYGALPGDFESVIIESVVTEAKTISFAKASMLGSKLFNKIKIGTIIDTKGGQYEVTGFGQQANAFKEFEATIDGKEVKVKLTAMYGLKLEVTDDVRSARFNKEEEINSIILESVVTESFVAYTENSKGEYEVVKVLKDQRAAKAWRKKNAYLLDDDSVDVKSIGTTPKKDWDKTHPELATESVVNEAKSMNRDVMIEWLQETMKFVSTTEEFDGSPGGIWVSGEDGETLKGKRIYDYYNEGSTYEFGVLKTWEKELNKRGWYSEWYDAGTVMIWQD